MTAAAAILEPNIVYGLPTLPYQFDRTMDPIQIGETHRFIENFLATHKPEHTGEEILPEEIDIVQKDGAVLVTFQVRTCAETKSPAGIRQLKVVSHLRSDFATSGTDPFEKWVEKPREYVLPGTQVRIRGCHFG